MTDKLTPKCGTYAGYIQHYVGKTADGEPCPPCREAGNSYGRRLKARHYLARAETFRVSATPSKRKIMALERMGWSLTAQGAIALPESSDPAKWIWNIKRQEKVLLSTHDRIDRMYRKISHLQGGNEAARRRGIRRGYPAPAAWDNIDDLMDRPQGMSLETVPPAIVQRNRKKAA